LLNAPKLGAIVALQENGKRIIPFLQGDTSEKLDQEKIIFCRSEDIKDRKGKMVTHKQLLIWEESICNISSTNRVRIERKTELNIATHNINSIKSNTHKMNFLYE